MTEGLISVVTIFAGVAVVALLLSPKATTVAVGQTLASGVGNTLGVAMSPVTGDRVSINTSYPGGSPVTSLGAPSIY